MLASFELNELPATQVVRLLARGEVRAESVIRACLERIEAREPAVGAWAFIDAKAAIAYARRLDNGPFRGALHGIPVGFKDVIDTADMPTSYNSAIYAGYRPAADAAVVALARRSGGIVLGKTVTTEFASRHPGPTRNPRNLAHTPGGSSSGSAAAVADRMVPLAVGTQTGGSTIRPAAYCGIVGYKPTRGMVSRVGLKVLSESLDTVGFMARSVPDLVLLLNAVGRASVPEDFADVVGLRPRIGFCPTPYWEEADEDARQAVITVADALAGAGASLSDAAMPAEFGRLWPLHSTVLAYESARAFGDEYARFPRKLSRGFREALRRAWEISGEEYVAARREVAQIRESVNAALTRYDALITPSAPGQAPKGLEDIGSSIFNRAWTILGVPCITLPAGVGSLGLPVGVQLVSQANKDAALLNLAEWAHRILS